MTALVLKARRGISPISHVAGRFGLTMQAVSLFLGLVVIVIAMANLATGMTPAQILGWSPNASNVFHFQVFSGFEVLVDF